MIESYSKKHMGFGIALLIVITILVLIIESRWAITPVKLGRNSNSTCWMHQEYSIVHNCHPCTTIEELNEIVGVCGRNTRYKEIIRCKNGELVSKACVLNTNRNEVDFWKFEIILFGVGSVSTLCAILRQHYLNRKTQMKIQRQLGRKI